MGGLARKATILDEKYPGNENFYIVDAGNLFFKKSEVEKGITLEVEKINSETILESFNAMGCTAFSPGEFDFAGGLDHLLELNKKANFPFTSCNIYDENDDLIFEEYVLEKNKDFTIAFIGLTSLFISDNIRIEEPIGNLKAVLKKLDKVSDINVLLFHGSEVDLSNLYTQNLDLDLIIRSKDRKRSSDGGSKIPTFSLGDRGKIVYQFDILIKDLNQNLTDLNWCENTISRVSTRLEKMKKGDLMVDLNELYKDNPATLRRIANYENQIIVANQRMRDLVNTLKIEKIELGKNVDGRMDILQIVDKNKILLESIMGPVLPKNIHQKHHPHDHDGDGIPDH